MTTMAPSTTTQHSVPLPAVPAGGARSGLARFVRRVLIFLHLATGLGWLGVTATFVVLTLWLLDVRDPATLRTGYAVHELMVVWLARPAAIGSAVTGLALTLAVGGLRRSRWWLWWVPAKFALVVATVVVTVTVSPDALRVAVERAEAVGTAAYTDTQYALVLMAFYHVVMISAAAVLAVFRPGARFRRPHRKGTA